MSQLKTFVKNLELSMNFLLLELHNKMGLYKGRIELYKIEYISSLSWRKQHMNSLREEDPISLTFINLDVHVTF
jgi:hypothetical protein